MNRPPNRNNSSPGKYHQEIMTINRIKPMVQNMTLLRDVSERLKGLRICGPGLVPANDGGLAFGQALVALARMEAN